MWALPHKYKYFWWVMKLISLTWLKVFALILKIRSEKTLLHLFHVAKVRSHESWSWQSSLQGSSQNRASIKAKLTMQQLAHIASNKWTSLSPLWSSCWMLIKIKISSVGPDSATVCAQKNQQERPWRFECELYNPCPKSYCHKAGLSWKALKTCKLDSVCL